MAILIDGKKIAGDIRAELKQETQDFIAQSSTVKGSPTPCLCRVSQAIKREFFIRNMTLPTF